MKRELIVEADGGSRGNPGVAGYGALVRDAASGELLAERAAPLGKASNNVAEYSGLIAGLEAAEAIDPGARVAVRMDSKLVVEQMAGRWKIKHEDMKRLALEANSLVRRRRAHGGDITWTWIPREINKDADKLSNDGMDGKHVVRDLWSPSGGAAADGTGVVTDPHAPVPPETDDAAVRTGTLFDTGPDAPEASPPPEPPRRPDTTTATTVVLLRHGVTDFTVEHKLDGRGGADPSLNAQGRRQASAAAEELAARLSGPVHVVSSSLSRARETGEAAARALGVALRVDAEWDEQDVGTWDGLTFAEIEAAHPGELSRMRSDDDFRPEGGESHTELASRVATAFQEAVQAAGPGGSVVVATHRKPLMVVLALILGISGETAWMLQADPASLTTLQVWGDGRAVVQNLNLVHHLS